jgi:hypothetical protein
MRFAPNLPDRAEDNSLASGFETSIQKNDEPRDRIEQLGGAAPTNIIEEFSPQVMRLAGYVQDEWNISRQLSIYLGTRWEGVQTDSSGTGIAGIRNRNHVLSPVLQTLYKLPSSFRRLFCSTWRRRWDPYPRY